MPIHADVRRLCRRGDRHPRCRSRRLARGSASRTLPALGRPRLRSGPTAVIHTHGTQGLHRGSDVVRRSLHLSDLFRATTAGQASGRLEARPGHGGRRRPPDRRTRRRRLRPLRPRRRQNPRRCRCWATANAREITVETATVRVVFSNRGARAVRWQLKHYRDTGDQLVDLVPSGLPDTEPRPFSLQVDDAKDTARLNTALYRVTGDQAGTFDASRGEPLVFEFQDENGLSARKEFRFDPTTYTLTATVTVRRRRHAVESGHRLGTRAGRSGCRGGRRQHLHRQRRDAASRPDSSWRRNHTPHARGRCGSANATGAVPLRRRGRPLLRLVRRERPERDRRISGRSCCPAPTKGSNGVSWPTRSSRPRPVSRSGSSSAPSSSTNCRRSAPTIRARSTSASSRGWSCRCCPPSSGCSASPAITAGRSSCSPSSSTW